MLHLFVLQKLASCKAKILYEDAPRHILFYIMDEKVRKICREKEGDMAGALNVRHGSKMRLAFDAPLGQEPKFNMICTFNKALDESAFLVSIPMVGGKVLPLDEKQKFLFQYEEGEETRIVAGYVDDEIKEGIRHYWKIRRVSEQRQLIRRADVRMKVTLPIEYMQDTWPLNANGEITKEKGETMDISNGGLAIYINRWFDVGATCVFTLPRIGTVSEGVAAHEVVGVVCWMREMPRGSAYRFIAGVQLRFADATERGQMQDYVSYVQKRYKL